MRGCLVLRAALAEAACPASVWVLLPESPMEGWGLRSDRQLTHIDYIYPRCMLDVLYTFQIFLSSVVLNSLL